MNTAITKLIPTGDFEEISIDKDGWKAQARFLKLVQEEKPIKYDGYTMPNLSKEIKDQVSKRGYCDLILDDDKDQHFLIPNTMTHGQQRR